MMNPIGLVAIQRGKCRRYYLHMAVSTLKAKKISLGGQLITPWSNLKLFQTHTFHLKESRDLSAPKPQNEDLHPRFWQSSHKLYGRSIPARKATKLSLKE
ncbi:hypothetical protein Mapa_000742 [Marchantia paleacea]|nr:hypothetical protein Mapa_000742 [Marchantia paleacea]